MANDSVVGAAKGKGDHPWVQPIIVAKYGTHEETVRLGALASAQVGLLPNHRPQDVAALESWLSGAFTKTVRRASYEQMMKVLAWCKEENIAYADAAEHDSAAIALPPMQYSDLPKVISRLQVSGTDLPREGADYGGPNGGLVQVDVLENLTTGKATAQAAHALWLWILQANDQDVSMWKKSEANLLDIAFSDPSRLSHLSKANPDLSIRDNGLTEIKAGTLTAVASSVFKA